MTQERYQEAAELQDGLVKDYKSLGMHEHRAACELAAEVLTKLASGKWKLVPGAPVAWIVARAYGSGLSFVEPTPYINEDGETVKPVPLYAAAPKP